MKKPDETGLTNAPTSLRPKWTTGTDRTRRAVDSNLFPSLMRSVTGETSTVLLVRHGETDWNMEGRLQGWGPTPLNERGRTQADRVGAALASEYSIDRVVASDLFRTRETAARIVQAGVDVEPTFDSTWRERGLGVYQGFTRVELQDRFPAFAIQNGAIALEETPAGGESIVDVYDRVSDGWRELSRNGDGETVLVVTHGGPITVVLAILKGMDILGAVQRHTILNCGLTVVEPETGTILRENELPFEPVGK